MLLLVINGPIDSAPDLAPSPSLPIAEQPSPDPSRAASSFLSVATIRVFFIVSDDDGVSSSFAGQPDVCRGPELWGWVRTLLVSLPASLSLGGSVVSIFTSGLSLLALSLSSLSS